MRCFCLLVNWMNKSYTVRMWNIYRVLCVDPHSVRILCYDVGNSTKEIVKYRMHVVAGTLISWYGFFTLKRVHQPVEPLYQYTVYIYTNNSYMIIDRIDSFESIEIVLFLFHSFIWLVWEFSQLIILIIITQRITIPILFWFFFLCSLLLYLLAWKYFFFRSIF